MTPLIPNVRGLLGVFHDECEGIDLTKLIGNYVVFMVALNTNVLFLMPTLSLSHCNSTNFFPFSPLK